MTEEQKLKKYFDNLHKVFYGKYFGDIHRKTIYNMKNLTRYDILRLTGKLPEEIEKEFDDEEWSKPYTDVDEMFRDLDLFSDNTVE